MFHGFREILIVAVLGLVAKFVGAGVMLAGVFAYVFGVSAYEAIRQARARWRGRPSWPQTYEAARPVEVAVEGFSEPGTSHERRDKKPGRGRTTRDNQEA